MTSAPRSVNAPCAIAWPVHAATIGSGNESIRSISSPPVRTVVATSAGLRVNMATSYPPENIPSRPARTTTAPSDSARSKAPASASSIAIDMTLALPSSIVIVAIESVSS